MSKVLFIGDELSAAAWRLAGVATLTPDPGTEQATVLDACPVTPLLMLGQTVADRLPKPLLTALLAGAGPTPTHPLVVVLPELAHPDQAPSLALALRSRLGLSA